MENGGVLNRQIKAKKINVENVAESVKTLTNVQTFRDCALHQWNVRKCFKPRFLVLN